MDRRRLASLSLALTLHVFCVLVLIPGWSGPDEGEKAATQAATPVAPPDEPAPAPKPADEKTDEIGKYLPRPTTLRVWGFDFDVAKIRTRWNALFPFITAPPSLDAEPHLQTASQRLVFGDPLAPPPALPPARPRLVMSETAMQQLLDRTWARRDRWIRFDEFAALVDAYHPTDGRLPAVIRAYIEQNALQPYEDTTFPDPRRWAMLALAADHQDFVGFIAPYVRAHPRTRTATELLFLLDALMQGSRETLALLLETSPRREMAWTRQENWQAWELFASLRDYYGELLEKRGLETPDAVRHEYDALRIDVLSRLVQLTPDGYRASDALFLIGRIRWQQGDREGAARAWRQMRVVRGDRYAETSARILDALADSSRVDSARIDAALEAEHRRWVALQFDRLRRFGYSFAMY
jgi:hypothetical protein